MHGQQNIKKDKKLIVTYRNLAKAPKMLPDT